ncbi:MAG: hypothetical protein ACOCYE_13090, partial [Pseudomonadota bacterium]
QRLDEYDGPVELHDRRVVHYPDDYPFVVDREHPGKLRSPWYDAECERHSAADVAQELDGSYDISGMTLFDQERLRVLDDAARMIELTFAGDVQVAADDAAEPVASARAELVADHRRWAELSQEALPPYLEWADPASEPYSWHRYGMACDPASGTGNDDTWICVGDANTGRQVAEYASNRIEAAACAELLAAIGRRWRWPFVVVEGDARGLVICRALWDAAYPGRIYLRHRLTDRTEPQAEDFGFSTSTRDKELRLIEYSKAVSRGAFVPVSRRAIKQHQAFGYGENGRLGREGVPDDAVRCLAYCDEALRHVPKGSPSPDEIPPESPLGQYIQEKRRRRQPLGFDPRKLVSS